MTPLVLPENLLKLMSAADRAHLGKCGVTASEAQERFQKTAEKRMHEEFERWLSGHHSHEVYWDHSRMDRATSNRVGHPDFVLQRGNVVLNIEFKAAGGHLSAKQREVHGWIERTGGKVHVCYSSAEAMQITRETFSI